MSVDSVQIPAPRVEPIAVEAASSAKSIAAVLFFFIAVFAFAALGIATDGGAPGTDGSSLVGGVIFWLVLLVVIAMRFVRGGQRAGAAARAAKADPSGSWYLSGRILVAMDAAGVPRPELSFKVSRKHRTMLLAIPRATVVPGAP